ncbi:hypothetical protein Lwal_3145 [Legionella waltersii]|uniref:Uncharacterized protein n=1 Tax=Legionella waltersii TaxID=66969 RepID=A0A0W1A1U5_9GAMM|nr:hypothetical protein Lwal_3145 [Legionella waltersii]SNV05084.1 Uncharacterised protein [Legionella waltersii]
MVQVKKGMQLRLLLEASKYCIAIGLIIKIIRPNDAGRSSPLISHKNCLQEFKISCTDSTAEYSAVSIVSDLVFQFS